MLCLNSDRESQAQCCSEHVIPGILRVGCPIMTKWLSDPSGSRTLPAGNITVITLTLLSSDQVTKDAVPKVAYALKASRRPEEAFWNIPSAHDPIDSLPTIRPLACETS